MSFRISKWKLFWRTLLVTIGVWLVVFYLRRPSPFSRPQLHRITGDIYITSQLGPESLPFLRSRGIKTLVDIRPDGEEPKQPSSSEIRDACSHQYVEFHYVPVPHDSIPGEAVDALQSVLSGDSQQTVLYCRTGRRAVRLFALAEASRRDGPSVDEILKMSRVDGFSADDLKSEIEQRISRRNGFKEQTTNE